MTISAETRLKHERETLEAIRRISHRGERPSLNKIAAELGMSGSGAVHYRVQALVDRGLVYRTERRTVALSETGDTARFVERLAACGVARADDYTDLNRAMADRLRAIRIDRKLTDCQLAKALGIRVTRYRRLEWGVDWINAVHIAVLARVLAVPADYFTADRHAGAALAKILDLSEELT